MAGSGMRCIGRSLEDAASRTPKKSFLVFADVEVSYQAFWQAVQRAASGLLGLGVRKGDKVAILLGNRLEFPLAWLAANAIGAVMVPVNAYVLLLFVKFYRKVKSS